MEDERLKIKGIREEKLDQTWVEMKVEQGKYFGGEALTWSVVEKVYKDILCGKFSFLEPIKDQKNLYDNHKTIFSILANVHKVISTKMLPMSN